MEQMMNDGYYDAIRAKIPELDYQMGLTTCVGDKDFYLELLTDFTELPIKDELDRFLKAADSKNYCICVHGFKNNAYSVGAKAIGDLAYELEKITKEGTFEQVLQVQTHMFELYDSVCRRFHETEVLP